jgi:hypothetical protein
MTILSQITVRTTCIYPFIGKQGHTPLENVILDCLLQLVHFDQLIPIAGAQPGLLLIDEALCAAFKFRAIGVGSVCSRCSYGR